MSWVSIERRARVFWTTLLISKMPVIPQCLDMLMLFHAMLMSFCSVFFWCQPFWKMRFTWMHDDRCSSTRLQRVVKCSMFWKRRHDWIVWFNYGFKVCLDMFGVSITWKLHSEYQLWGCDLLLQDMQTAKQFCYLRYPQALQIHWRIRCTYFTWRDITRYACNMFRCSFLQHTLASDRMEPFFARW